MNEKWVPVPGTDGMIEISNFGNAMSYLRNREQGSAVKATCDSAGYPTLRITINRVKKNYLVHRCVAQAFIPNPLNKREVNHIDGNKANNHVANLEWATHKENLQHAASTGLLDGVAKASSIRNKKRISATDGEKTIEFDSLKSAAEYFGLSNTANISAALHGRRKACAGHRFVWIGGDN